jgi:Holliday junction resolvase RusA-like endonuclease
MSTPVMRYSAASSESAYFHLVREGLDLPVVTTLCIDGEPISKARARFTRNGHSYTPEKTVTGEAKVRAAFVEQAPNHELDPEATYGVTALFFHATRQRRDVDNMIKLILDGLTGVAWVDDVQVVEVSGRKCLEAPDHARTEVVIYKVGGAQRLTIACEFCGTHFHIFPGNKRRFCSRKCSYASRVQERPACPVCGEAVGELGSTYCSRSCMGVARSKPTPRCIRCSGAVSKQGVQLCRPCWATRGAA